MNTVFFMIVTFVVVTHFLGILWLAYTAWKPLKCQCGHRFEMPKVGKYICPRCKGNIQKRKQKCVRTRIQFEVEPKE